MQGFGNYCDQMKVNDTLTLRDTRDDNEYTIAKLKDDRCWMTQNLKIQGNKTIYPSDSNIISSSYTIQSGDVSPSPKTGCGNFYTPTAASAGTSTYNSNVNYSICPRGWRLPTSNEVKSMISNYTNNVTGPPLLLYMCGEKSGGGSGNYEYIWVSTPNPSTHNMGEVWIKPGGSTGEGYGGSYTIRCTKA